MSIRPGRVLSVAIVLAWAGLMGVHLSRSYSPAGAKAIDFSTSTRPTAAELTQRGVFYRGARIGYIRERHTPLDGGYRAEQSGQFALELLGRQREMQMEGAAETGPSGQLVKFQFHLSTSSGSSPFETTVLGEVDDDELTLTIRSAGATGSAGSAGSERTERRSLDQPIVLPLNLYYSLASGGWTSGQSYRVRLFDPMTLSEGEALVAVKEREIVRWGGHEEEAFRLETTFAGLTTTAWVNERGEVLQEETPLGWTLRKEAPGSGLQAQEQGHAPDVLVSAAVPAIGFAGDATALSTAKLELDEFPDGFEALDGGRQRLDGNGVWISRESPPFARDGRLDARERESALASDAFIQADDPRIISQAESVTRGMSDVAKAEALTFWVYENLTKSPTLSVPSATEVLEQRVGDCNEHTILFTALSRAAELPTRIATGLAFTSGQFYYHAWPEVWVGRWLAVDPTFGQFPADPLHVRLLTGGLEKQYEVLKLMGRGATIEILETR